MISLSRMVWLLLCSSTVAIAEPCPALRGTETNLIEISGGSQQRVQTTWRAPDPVSVRLVTDTAPIFWSATLNGENISDLFSTEPGRWQALTLPLVLEDNTLVVVASFAEDRDDANWTHCAQPPRHWQQWLIANLPVPIGVGPVEIITSTPEDFYQKILLDPNLPDHVREKIKDRLRSQELSPAR